MNQLIDRIDSLIEEGTKFTWENCSYSIPQHGPNGVYGLKPSPNWKTWATRIERLITHAAKPNGEPFVYLESAQQARIEGNHRDQFDQAKTGYLGALESLRRLLIEGDIFGELLEPHSSSQPLETEDAVTTVATAATSKKVFIVHGHDHQLKIELEVFLSRLGLTPIVLHREVDGGKTIIEKFESNSDVAFVFILLTPDDVVFAADQQAMDDSNRLKEFRARQNVIFEFGYFVAKLGRQRVCALHKGDVAIPSDLSGLIYKKVETDVEAIGFALLKELKAVGLKLQL
jgi:predicted nucleotide-binding protein